MFKFIDDGMEEEETPQHIYIYKYNLLLLHYLILLRTMVGALHTYHLINCNNLFFHSRKSPHHHHHHHHHHHRIRRGLLPIVAEKITITRRQLILQHVAASATAAVLSLSSPSKAAVVGDVGRGNSTWIPPSDEILLLINYYGFNSISSTSKANYSTNNLLLYMTADDERIPLLTTHMHQLGGGGRTSYKEDRPRFFDSKASRMCWDKAKQVPGRDPDRWRIDAAGNVVCKRLHTCQGCLCFEYDHIIPFSRGGESVVDNCQILQTRVNRLKSDKNGVDQRSLKGYSCDIKFSDEQLDIIEMAVYGSVVRPGKQCIVGNVDALIGKNKSRNHMIICNKND